MMDLSSLLSSLSEDDMQKLKDTAMQFFGKDEEKAEPQKIIPFNPEIISSVAKLSEMMNSSDDRCNFIYALKPLLSEKRQKKADDAVMMLKFMKIVNVFGGHNNG